MNLRFSGLYHLQTYFKKDDPQSAIIFLTVVGSVLAIFIIIRRAMGATDPGGDSKKGSSSPARQFSAFALRRAARSYGLTRDQTKMLGFVLKNNEAIDPEQLLSDPAEVDNYFKRAYRNLRQQIDNEDEAQIQIALLFSTLNAIEFTQSASSSETSPRIIAGMAAVLAAGGGSYPVKVLDVRGDSIQVECPTNVQGTFVKISLGAKVILSFFTRTNNSFAVECQVTGTPSARSKPVLELTRSSRSKNLVQRRFKRRQVGIPCYVRPVKIEETGKGRKKTVRMTVDQRRFTGAIQDISVGGCSIKMNESIAAGSRVKIEFNYGGSAEVAVLGQILRFNRNGLNTVVHTKFLKVPRKAMNIINIAVFNYPED
jgi:hypothetical protein